MLDQSFSAHNIETIYCLESRRGNIDIHSMPEQYRDILTRSEELKREITSLKQKKGKTQEDLSIIKNKREEYKRLVGLKKDVLCEYLATLEHDINKPGFKFKLRSYTTSENKEVFTLDTPTHAHLFAIKQLQYNIRHAFKVKQDNRHSILTNIKAFLNSNIPVYIIRTDISKFYESIPQDKLKRMIFDNTLLSNKSKSFINGILMEYENIKDTSLATPMHGLPRGIGISSYLSEVYMRNIDSEISRRREVMFYARYVDDIFIILSSLPSGKNLGDYYADITDLFQKNGLSLKQTIDTSGKCRIMDFTQDNQTESPMNYLGYSLCISREQDHLSTTFGLSEKKKDRYRKKIDNAITHFETLSKCNIKQAYQDLFDSLNIITGNFKLFKSKSGVKVGLYYHNDLLDCFNDLDELTDYLRKHTINPYVGLKDCDVIKAKIEKRIANIDFKQRWLDRKMFTFNIHRIQEIEKWL